MRKEAEAHAAEDRRKVEVIEARNQADAVIFSLEKQLKELGDKISANDRQAIQSAIERTKQAASGEDVQAIRQAVSDLQAAAQAMAQHMHRPGDGGEGGGFAGGGESPKPGGGGGKDDVIDAEFEVKK